ncbi:hypothetical protein [Metabacillus fastidiosus]|uniref:hypothetical protein n=1 Tax=Metabacillus fastidiosus TaxID=1458 RepID=UPI002E1D5BFB|nr:hypothetical protein [Metabacillus fastidiosus]
MKDQFIRARVSQDIIDKINDLVKHYNAISVGTINKTNIIELAINELHKEMKEGKR